MEQENREHFIQACVGGKGVGKTYTTRLEIANAIKNGRKALIFDASLDPELTNYKPLRLEDIGAFMKQKTPEIRRILGVDRFGQELSAEGKLEMLKDILSVFRGGILVIEDFNNYAVQVNHIPELIGIITTNRHKNLDIIFHFQSLKALDTRMFQNVKWVRLHKDLENPDTMKDRLSDKYELFKIASIIVDTEFRKDTPKGRRFYCYVATDAFKIHGVTNKQFANACVKYLKENNSQISKIKKANSLKTDIEAYKYFISEKKQLYFPKKN